MISKFFKHSRSALATAITLAFTAVPAVYAQNFTVADIRLEGLQRVAASNVFGLLNIDIGDQISDEDVAGIVRDVFASEYFANVEVLTEDNVLIIRVEERPTIAEVNLDGNKLLKTEQLLDNLSQNGVDIGQVYMPQVLEGISLALEEQYVQQGMYGASVELDVVELERNRVELNINITEGDASKIVHINIEGNTVFEEDVLLEFFELQESHLTSFFKKDDRYAREKLNGDLERLSSFYMDQGYINFDVSSVQVSITPDKEEVYITINLNEGEVYTVNEVELAGDLVDLESLLRFLILVREGQVFSQQLVTSTSEFMKQQLNRRGYFFAEIEGVPQIDEDNKTVDITFFVVPGSRTYINRISFRGNTNTADEVLRREMRQMEGSPASNELLEQSKVRLERLGYFANVNFETATVPGTTDQIDVEYSVEEQLSGSIGGSLGYGQVQGFIVSANLQQGNFLGTGKSIGVNVNSSSFSTNYSFNYFDPYYTIDGVSRGYSLSFSKNDYAALRLSTYSTNQLTLSTSYGYQLNENQSLSFNVGLNNTNIEVGLDPVKEIKGSPVIDPRISDYIVRPARASSSFDPVTGQILPIQDAIYAPLSSLPESAFSFAEGFLDQEGTDFLNLSLGISWNESTLNFGLFPTSGASQSLSLDFTLPGSDLTYYRVRYAKEQYFPISGEWIVHASMDLGYGNGYGSTKQLPFFQNFYAGGQGTVRGFERYSLGPHSTWPEYYVTETTTFLKDSSGNVILDPTGSPIADPNAPPAYQLEQQINENGLVFDEDGNPVYNDKLYVPRSLQNQTRPFGGNIQATGTIELMFPMPMVKDRSRMRSSFFLDAGNVFSSHCTQVQELNSNCRGFSLSELRYSAGVAVSWQSGAFGIMTFSLAKPFNASNIDEKEVFQFNIGNQF